MQIEKCLFRWKNEMGLNVCFLPKKVRMAFSGKISS